MKRIIQDLTKTECIALAERLGEKKFRGTQLYEGLTAGKTVNEITTLSASFKSALLQEYENAAVEIVERLVAKDGTEKYLFRLADGNVIEGVLMKY